MSNPLSIRCHRARVQVTIRSTSMTPGAVHSVEASTNRRLGIRLNARTSSDKRGPRQASDVITYGA
jgi:hypothetical protein